MSTTINPEKLAQFESIELDHGAHVEFADGHCAMEVVAWLADEGHTDAPSCASPVLRDYTIALNDRWDNEKRQQLKPYLIRMIGTGDDGKDDIRRKIATTETARLVVPWYRLAGMTAEADAIVAAGDDPYLLRSALRAARDKAWELRRASRLELREKVCKHLERNRPADAAAVAAVAAAAAVAAVAAVAAAVAAADAAADAVAAVAAADAAADAAVAAAAVAAADAAADAAVAAADAPADWWGKPYQAAYAAAREHFKEHPLPIEQAAKDLAADQDGAALALLDRLIAAEVQ